MGRGGIPVCRCLLALKLPLSLCTSLLLSTALVSAVFREVGVAVPRIIVVRKEHGPPVDLVQQHAQGGPHRARGFSARPMFFREYAKGKYSRSTEEAMGFLLAQLGWIITSPVCRFAFPSEGNSLVLFEGFVPWQLASVAWFPSNNI